MADYYPLIARAILVHTLRDMRRLAVEIVVHLDLFPVKLLLLIADVAHAIAHDPVHSRHHLCRRLFR